MAYDPISGDLDWQQVDWSYVPFLEESLSGISFYAVSGERVSGSKFTKDQILEHPKSMSVDDLLDLYRENGFDTDVILQNPFTHRGPAAVCPVGFPLNLPKALEFPEIKKFRRWVCRIHVDVSRGKEDRLLSIPHIEVDPVYHSVEHLRFLESEVYGPTAVKILKMLLS